MSIYFDTANFIIMLTILFNLVISANIIPDSQYPLQLISHAKYSAGQSLVFRFMLPSESVGLNYRHFIGVNFPPSTSANDDLKLAEAGVDIKWSCELTDVTNKITVSAYRSITSPNRSESAENNIAYCRLDDTVNNSLKPNVSYKLSLKFSKIFSMNFIRTIGLFTSTANHSEKIVIDSLPVFGNLGMYGNWEDYTPRSLDVTNVSTTVTTGPSNSVIYPYSTFDLSLTIKVNSFISINDVYIIVKYPSANVVAAQTVSSSAFSYGDLNSALKGNIAISTFSSDSLLISGITEDLIPNRTFKIDLKQWRALDTVVGTDAVTNRDLIVMVYYKNTYSVISYSKNVNTFTISKTSITISSIKHPEDWDIYRSGAWPLQFTFKTNSDLINGGWVLVQHSNAKDLINRMTFLSSSCDLSDMDSEDNSSYNSINCYPKINDFGYTDNSFPNENKGSAFFFKAKSLLSSKEYRFTVWIYADDCGGNVTDNFKIINKESQSNVQFEFKITVFKFVYPDPIIDVKSVFKQVILGDSVSNAQLGKCWDLRVQSKSIETPTATYKPNKFNIDNDLEAFYKLPNNNFSNSSYIEINDLNMNSQSNDYIKKFADDILRNPTESYIYSTSYFTNSSYFNIKNNIQFDKTFEFKRIFAIPNILVFNHNQLININEKLLFSKGSGRIGQKTKDNQQ